MKKTIGILAHVDAGKTTFSEQILFAAGVLRSAGRVDHKNSFLDLHPVERERGITVFSDQAVMDIGENRYYWLDTPGHTDFAAEMERVIPVLDYAVIIVSCVEGVESHTETVWSLLKDYNVPVLFFVNKTDRTDASFDSCLAEMRSLLSRDIFDMQSLENGDMDKTLIEAIAERDESLFERLMEDDYDYSCWEEALIRQISERRLFPVFRGSALYAKGIPSFLKSMDRLTRTEYDRKSEDPFAARVYKVRRDEQNARWVYLKITAGRLQVKSEIDTPYGPRKINDLRLRHGGKFITVHEAAAGDIVCTTSLNEVRIGEGLGTDTGTRLFLHTEPMLEISVSCRESLSVNDFLAKLKILEDEDPALHVNFQEKTREISLRVMGSIQTEILARIAAERFHLTLEFGKPRILYMETVTAPSCGVGHYEPLRHYAEVILRILPAPRGSGIRFRSACHVDDLALNWQRLIETHIFERSYPGVLIGAPLTDVEIELLAGRAHLKHTEGGDFREATCRALRCALMNGSSTLLEPVIRFSLCFSPDSYGRIAGDLNRMHASTEKNENIGDWVRMEGTCTYAAFLEYPVVYREITHGRGLLNMHLSHYAPCSDEKEIVASANYNPYEEDTPDSVFCSHGAGHVVNWKEALVCAHCAGMVPKDIHLTV